MVFENIAKSTGLSVDVIRATHTFLREKIFNRLEKENTVTLKGGYTTLSYLTLKYHIKMGDFILSINVLFETSGQGGWVYDEYLRSDFAFLNGETGRICSVVRVFEGDVERYKEILYKHVLPLVKEMV